jgi:hypothetical protein
MCESSALSKGMPVKTNIYGKVIVLNCGPGDIDKLVEQKSQLMKQKLKPEDWPKVRVMLPNGLIADLPLAVLHVEHFIYARDEKGEPYVIHRWPYVRIEHYALNHQGRPQISGQESYPLFE